MKRSTKWFESLKKNFLSRLKKKEPSQAKAQILPFPLCSECHLWSWDMDHNLKKKNVSIRNELPLMSCCIAGHMLKDRVRST